jgi:hypothetical protein
MEMYMEYQIIQPQVRLDFQVMTRKEANDYFRWFMEQIPTRMEILTRAVRSTRGYENWQTDFTVNSLDKLGQWFCEQVETRDRTTQEKEDIYSKAPAWFRNVNVESWELSNQTFSLAVDIGMYLGSMIEKNHEGIKWIMVTRPKNDVDYQQPVLVGKSNLVLNPVRIVIVYAYSIPDKTRGPEGLREIYQIWTHVLTK